ncbi:hypothetical protein SCACP_21650 [Sporomusa carbonis]|uniref:hypothetical protein n=1 Tax=Sporomusa carbonis TaxID=3076075 RepID=UPI003A7AC23F
MPAGKSVNSYKLPYPKPRIATELTNVQQPAPPRSGYHPVHCVKNNIPLDQAFCLKPEDLTEEDFRAMVDHGTRKQTIKRLYGFRNDAEFYKWLRNHKLHPYTPEAVNPAAEAAAIVEQASVQPETAPEEGTTISNLTAKNCEPEPAPAEVTKTPKLPNEFTEELRLAREPLPDEIITDPDKIAELMTEPPSPDTSRTPDFKNSIYKGFTWFYGQQSSNPVITVYEDGRFSIPAAIRKTFVACLVSVGLSEEGMYLVVTPSEKEKGFTLKPKQQKYRDIELSKMLKKIGIALPARYAMSWNEAEQLWAGTLEQTAT